jgi:transcriptional regulator with XRE-family HTH domain
VAKDPFKVRLGRLLRTARERQGRTQAQVGEAVRITPEAISRIERGLAAPKAQTLLELMVALGVQRDDLLTRGQLKARERLFTSPVLGIAYKLAGATPRQLRMIARIVGVLLSDGDDA